MSAPPYTEEPLHQYRCNCGETERSELGPAERGSNRVAHRKPCRGGLSFYDGYYLLGRFHAVGRRSQRELS